MDKWRRFAVIFLVAVVGIWVICLLRIDATYYMPYKQSGGIRESKRGAPIGKVDQGIRSPIVFKMEVLSDHGEGGEDSGGEVMVGVTLRPLIDAPDIRWFVEVPEGLDLVSGPSTWEGKMDTGEEREFQLVLSVPDGRRYELYGRAEVYPEEGGVVTKGAGLRIDLGGKDIGPYPPFVRMDAAGGSVIGYKGLVRKEGR